MKKLYTVFLLIAGMLFSSSAFASVGTQEDGGNIDQVTDINYTTNIDRTISGSVATVKVTDSPTFSGDVTFRTTLLTGGRKGAASSISSSDSGILPSTLPYSFLKKSIGNNVTAETATLADGTVGQLLSINIAVCGPSGSWVVTPTTSARIRTIKFDTTGDSATLIYDATLGWEIVSQSGCTVTYK